MYALASQPWRIFIAAWAFFLALKVFKRFFPRLQTLWEINLERIAIYLGFLLPLIPLGYLFQEKLADHGESHCIALAAAWLNGQELYPSWDGPFDYWNFYGPAMYFVYGIFPKILNFLLGYSFIWAKLPAILALFGSVWLFWLTLKREGIISSASLKFTLVLFLGLLSFGIHPYHVRPDPLLLFLVSLSLFLISGSIITKEQLKTRSALLGVTVGIALQIKIHAWIYFLPSVAALLLSQYSAGPLAIFVGVTGTTFLAPWILVPTLSLKNHFEILKTAVDQGRDMSVLFKHYLPFAFWISLPVWLTHWRGKIETKLLLLSLLAASFAAAKPGAGEGHFLPLMFPIMFFAIRGGQQIRFKSFLWAWLLSLVIVTSLVQVRSVKQYRGNAKFPVLADIQSVESRYPGLRTAVGWGDNELGDHYHLSFYRAYFVWKQHPYPFDLGVQMDHVLVNRRTPPSARGILEECLIELWLIPKGESPFAMKAWTTREVMYPRWFTDLFNSRYERVGASDYYDLWRCKK